MQGKDKRAKNVTANFASSNLIPHQRPRQKNITINGEAFFSIEVYSMKDLRVLVLSLRLAVILTACSYPEHNFTGSEYMHDLAHPLAVEAITYNY